MTKERVPNHDHSGFNEGGKLALSRILSTDESTAVSGSSGGSSSSGADLIVEEGGSVVVAAASALNAGHGLDVTDQGGGVAGLAVDETELDGSLITGRFPWVNAADYGVVGDDTTNDTAALQAAMDATVAFGTLFIGLGTFKVTGAITRDAADGPINIIGAGSKHGGTTIHQVTANTDCLVINVDVLSTYTSTSIDNNRNYDIASSVSHLRIVGPTGSTNAHAGAGIYALTDLILTDVATYGFNAGAFWDWRSYYALALGCKFSAATTYGAIHKGYNFSAFDCQFWNSGYGLWMSGSQNMRVRDCVFEQNATAGLYADGALQGSLTSPASTITVSGCYFEETATAVPDIVIGATTVVTGVTIENSHFQANAQGDTGASWHIDLYKATEVTISTNRLYGGGSGGGDIRASVDTVYLVLINQPNATTSGLPSTTIYLDKDHPFLSGGTPGLTLGTANSAGTATTGVRTDATIALFDATVPAAVGTAATGSVAKAAHRDHVHPTGAGTPSTQAIGDAAATGTGPAASMTDHKHAMPAFGSPVAIGTTNADGTATTLPRSDHVHAGSNPDGQHVQVVGETHLSDGSTTTYTLDQAFEPGSVEALNTTTLAYLTVTETDPDQVTVSAAGSTGDKITFSYAGSLA